MSCLSLAERERLCSPHLKKKQNVIFPALRVAASVPLRMPLPVLNGRALITVGRRTSMVDLSIHAKV